MPIPSQLRRRRRELTQNVKCQAVHPVLHWGQGHPSHLASSPPANKILPKYLQSIFYYYGKNEIKKKKACIHTRESVLYLGDNWWRWRWRWWWGKRRRRWNGLGDRRRCCCCCLRWSHNYYFSFRLLLPLSLVIY